eukprot:748154-Hanusia_phi.AAC.1
MADPEVKGRQEEEEEEEEEEDQEEEDKQAAGGTAPGAKKKKKKKNKKAQQSGKLVRSRPGITVVANRVTADLFRQVPALSSMDSNLLSQTIKNLNVAKTGLSH